MINNAQYEFSCGVEFETVVDIQHDIDRAYDLEYQFIMIPIAHPRFNRDFTAFSKDNKFSKQVAFTRSDTLLQSNYWRSSVVGKVSETIDLDSIDPIIKSNSVKTLKQEISWAAHLSLPSILLPTPLSSCCPNYAQVVNQSLQSLSYMKIWIRIPLVSPKSQLLNKSDLYSDNQDSNPWEWWNNFRLLCNHHPSLSVVLELTEDLPTSEQLQQWLGEPIKCVIIPTSIFLTNKAGYPTLSKAHQQFLKQLFNYNIQFVVCGASMESLKEYKTYLKFLHTNQDPLTEEEYFEMPYLDFLQAPLQPLMDNLESQTYEIFEKDPIKYKEYQNAVRLALLDIDKKESKDDPIIIMVVGAGRGPLVNCSIQASIEANKFVKVFAIEKNPNAIVTLRNRIIIQGWEEIVTVIDSDMRDWVTDYRADIMVSELLGSFGDNELSPECLDGAQKYLKENGGISIPNWYTSYIAPISSSKLFNEVNSFGEILKYSETPYVVKPHNFHQLAESKPLFTFTHPNRDTIIDNSRFETLEFDLSISSTTCHGFIGYFDCCLYKDVHISINPKNFSTGMFSWFPIYFPLKQPIYFSTLSDKESIKVKCAFWRNVTKSKVWYEWSLLSPTITPIQNVGGRSYYIGL